MSKLKCVGNPVFEYWLEVTGFCARHKDMIVKRIDQAIADEVAAISEDLELDLDSIESTQKPSQFEEQLRAQAKKETLH